MLDIDKSTVDFLVTENMVQEVEKVLSHDVPLVHAIVEEMVKRDIDRIYFVACGSPLNAAQTAKHLADRFSDLQVYAISGWEFCDNTPYRPVRQSPAGHGGTLRSQSRSRASR